MKNSPLLVTMSGPGGLLRAAQPSDAEYLALDDFNAGLVALSMIEARYPGISFLELVQKPRRARRERMEGFGDWISDRWDDAEDAVSSVAHAALNAGRAAGHTVGEIARGVGHAGGEVMRSVMTDKVKNFLNSTYSCYTASGGWTGAVTGNQGDTSGDACRETPEGSEDWIAKIGQEFKDLIGGGGLNEAGIFGIPGKLVPWAIAASAVLVVMFAKPGAEK